MATPRQNQTITTQGSFLVGKIPGDRQGTTLLISGNFNSAQATAAYKAADGTFVDFQSADATLTATGEISVVAGNGIEIYLTVSLANPVGIDVIAAYW